MSLATLLFSDYRRKVLGLLLLHPDERYHLREIARRTGTQPGTLARELNRLAEAGVLTCEQVGNQRLYSADLQCPIYSELAGILRKTSGLCEVLAEALAPLAGRIEVAFVFGSMASGSARAGSDIDLMLIGSASFAELLTLLYPAQQQLGREINPKVCTPQEWRELLASHSAFARELQDKPRLYCIGTAAGLRQLEEQG